MKAITACAAPVDPCIWNTAEHAVCNVKKTVIPMPDAMNNLRLPILSQYADAKRAQHKFQICRIPLMRSWLKELSCDRMCDDMSSTYLGGPIRDTNAVKYFVEVVRYQAIAGPLGEKRKSKDNPHTLPVSDVGKQ
jgi:hypothetical protein